MGKPTYRPPRLPVLALASSKAPHTSRTARIRYALRARDEASTRTRVIFSDVNETTDPVPALKQQLAGSILERMRGGCQHNLASRLGVDQPRASNLRRGQLERFSLQQLVRFAARVDGEVTINVTWTSRRIWIFPQRKERQPATVRRA